MGTSIERRSPSPVTLSLTTSTATTERLPYGIYAGGHIHVPAGSSITSITYNAWDEVNGAYSAMYDNASTPAAVTQTVAAGRSYPIRDEAFGCRTLVLVGDAAGDVVVDLKG